MDVPRQFPHLIKTPPPSRVRFGAFELDLNSGELSSGGEKVLLQEQPLQILRMLTEANGEVVSRDAIRGRLWPDDTVVEFDHSINAAIKNLRRALADSAQEPRYIETIARRGYRLMVAVEEVPSRVALVPKVLPGEPAEVKTGEPPGPKPAFVEPRKGRIREILRRPFWLLASALALIAVIATGWRFLNRASTVKRLATERPITSNPPEDRVLGGAVSPDGKFVAYLDQTGVYVRAIDSGETHPVQIPSELSGRMLFVRWFPEGGKLVTEASTPEGWDIWEINVLGEAEPKLLFRNGFFPAVSPDGQMIAYSDSEYAKENRAIWLAGTNGETPRKFAEAQPDERVMSPAWSPDGRWLAYIRVSKTGSAIVIRRAAGGAESGLVADHDLPSPYRLSPLVNEGLAWCGDGGLVFPVSNLNSSGSIRPQSSLWRMRVNLNNGQAESKPVRLTADATGALLNLTCAENGKRLSVLKSDSWDDVYIADLASDRPGMKPPRRLTLDNRGSGMNTWTRDSRAVFFQSWRNGTSQIFLQAVDSNAADLFVQGPGEVSGAEVSPDGAWLLYRETAKGESHRAASNLSSLMRKPVAGGAPERLLEITGAEEFQCASNTTAIPACVLSHAGGDKISFYALDPLKGKGRQLAEVPYSSAQISKGWSISPGGSQIALLYVDQPGSRIVIIDITGGPSRQITLESDIGKLYAMTWAADGTGFYGASRGTDSWDVLYVTLAGKERTLWRTNRRQFVFHPIPSFDGKHLAFTAQTWYSDVWLIDNF